MVEITGRLRRLASNVSGRVSSFSLPVMLNERGEDFYQELRRRVADMTAELGPADKMTGIILAAPDMAHLCIRLLFDSRVSRRDKAKLMAAVLYFASPVDLFPEALLGPIGWLDNVALIAYVLHLVVNNAGPEVVREHWAGDDDILEFISRVLATTNDVLGSRIIDGVEKYIGRPIGRIVSVGERKGAPGDGSD